AGNEGIAAKKGRLMRTMRVVALVLLLCGAGIQARAEDQPSPEALAAAKELMAVISPDMMKQLAGSISATFWPVVEQKARADKIEMRPSGNCASSSNASRSPSRARR